MQTLYFLISFNFPCYLTRSRLGAFDMTYITQLLKSNPNNICVALCIVCFVSFYVLFVCKCVLYFCHRVTTQLQLTNIYHIISQPQGHPPHTKKFWLSLQFKCTGYSRQLKIIKLRTGLWASSDFRLKVDICALLRYYAVYGDNSSPTFRDNLPAPSSKVNNLFF